MNSTSVPPTGSVISSPSSDYTVERELGSGTFGYVLQCLKKATNKRVALKMIKNLTNIEGAKK